MRSHLKNNTDKTKTEVGVLGRGWEKEARSVKCFLFKYQKLSPMARTHKKLDVTAHVWDKVEGDSEICWPASQNGKL